MTAAAAAMPMPAQVSSRSKLMRWLQRDKPVAWGLSPDELDPHLVMQTVRAASRMFGKGRYFGLEVDGIERVPDENVMIVSNHSGGTTIPDVWGFGVAWYRHFGASRPIHPMAHEMVFSLPSVAKFFGRRGVLRGSRQTAWTVLNEYHRDLMVMPGGDVDTWRPYSKRYDVTFGGRKGYAVTALKAGVPIVPVANAGAHQTLYVISDGRRLARALRLPQIARAQIFPVSLSFPWGLTIGPLPHLPIPTTLRYKFASRLRRRAPSSPDRNRRKTRCAPSIRKCARRSRTCCGTCATKSPTRAYSPPARPPGKMTR